MEENNDKANVLNKTEKPVRSRSDRKAAKYYPLLTNLWTEYTNIHFVSLSMSTLGIFRTSSGTFSKMLNDLNFNRSLAHYP